MVTQISCRFYYLILINKVSHNYYIKICKMKKIALLLQLCIQKSKRVTGIIVSESYINWKRSAFLTWSNSFFQQTLIITLLFQLITSLIYLRDQSTDLFKIVNFAILPSIIIVIFVIQLYFKWYSERYQNSNYVIFFAQFSYLIKQLTIEYFLFSLNCQADIVIGIIQASYIRFFPDLSFKGASLICFLLMSFLKLDSTLYLVFCTIFLLIIISIAHEFEKITEFLNFTALFNLIEIIPQAICIVNKQSNELVYTNEEYELLAKKLSQIPNSSESPTNLNEKQQLDLLSNLHLQELVNEGISINDLLAQFDEDGLVDDVYKIKKVLYSKNQADPILSNKDREDQPMIVPFNKKRQTINHFFKLFRNDAQVELIRKTYTSNINLIVEVNHQPQNFIQSALKRSRKKSSICQSKDIQKSMSGESAQRQKGQELQSFSPQKQKEGKSCSLSTSTKIQHKMKFMVHIMENFKIQNEELKVYFLNNLNPMMLQTKVKKLEQVKKNLMRSISHELVTYLNGAYIHLSYACENTQNVDTELAQQISTAFKYVTLQLYKIYDFQDFQDILTNQLTLNNDEVFNLNNALQFCFDLLKDQIDSKKLLLSISIPKEEQLLIQGDQKRFKQVILNLLSNAIRFTLQGGITVQVTKNVNLQNLEQLDGLVLAQTNFLEIRISDSGIGMNEEQMGILTKKLLSIDEDDKISKNSVGIGMGLSVTQAILKLLSPENVNTIFVESKESYGSQFFFFIKPFEFRQSFRVQEIEMDSVQEKEKISTEYHIQPLKLSLNNKFLNKKSSVFQKVGLFFNIFKGNELSFSDISDTCKCKSILIVDDEQFNIDALKYILGQMPFTFEQSLNGQDCLVRLENRILNKCCLACCIYKCILLDINMPIMNGWETVRRIRQIEKQSFVGFRIPIIAVTAFSSPEDRAKCMRVGFDFVIIKPATKQSLQQAFNQLKLNIKNI